MARLDEAQATLLSVTGAHKQQVADIIGRHQSKRIVKKKERLWTAFTTVPSYGTSASLAAVS